MENRNNTMKQEINAENIKTLALYTTILSATAGAASSYPLHVMYPDLDVNILFNTTAFICFTHTLLAFAAQDGLRREFGWRSPVKIIKNSFTRSRRKIPLNANGKSSDIFMSSISLPSLHAEETESFTVRINNINYTVPLSDMENFIRAVWARQRNGEPGLSRTYWVKQRRPRLKTVEYDVRIRILENVPGLILDRGQGRSGRLAASPLLIMDALV